MVALAGTRDEPRQQLGEGQRVCWHSETQGPQAVVPKPRGQDGDRAREWPCGSPPGTHADVQVLQEVLKQAGA